MSKRLIIFFVIIFLAFALRIIGLGSRPVGFTWDEAALGYNAYSLLQTGKDEYGVTSPLVFRSFGDYKPGLYVYFTVPSVAIFGLNEFATRLPSAIFGSLLVGLVFVLTRYLFPENESRAHYFAMIVSAFNPWLLNFSRGAWEANLSLLLTVLAATLFIRNTIRNQQNPITNLLPFLFFGLTFWSYQSAKLMTPLVIFSLVIVYLRQIQPKKLITPFILLFVLLLPILINLGSQSGRLKVFSVFSYQRQPADVEEILRQDNTQNKDLIYYVFHSEISDQLKGVFQRYLNHLSPRFLFSEGDWTNTRHGVFRQGYFYYTDLILIAIGLIYLIKTKSRSLALLLLWIVISPIPSALSRDLVSGVRSLSLSVPLCIISGLGLSILVKRKFFFIPVAAVAAFLMVYYAEFYVFHQGFYSGQDWIYPYAPAFNVIKNEYPNYSKIYFTDKLGQPYIFALFYLKFDPAVYQAQATLLQDQSGDVGQVTQFDKFRFGPVFWPSLRGERDALFIGGQYELPEQDLVGIPGLSRISDINYPDGTHALRIVGIKKYE